MPGLEAHPHALLLLTAKVSCNNVQGEEESQRACSQHAGRVGRQAGQAPVQLTVRW